MVSNEKKSSEKKSNERMSEPEKPQKNQGNLFCLRVSRQAEFSHKVKDNIHFLITLAVYLFWRMDDDFLDKLIDDNRR